jgi:hypothetical protein
MADPIFPRVVFRGHPGIDDGHGSDNFQAIPPLPNSLPGGAIQRSQLFTQFPAAPPAPGVSVPSTTIGDPWHLANILTGVQGGAAAGDVIAIPRNENKRNLLCVRNTSAAAAVAIDFGQPATANSCIQLAAGQTVLFDVVVPQDDIHIAGLAAAWAVSFIYSTVPNL